MNLQSIVLKRFRKKVFMTQSKFQRKNSKVTEIIKTLRGEIRESLAMSFCQSSWHNLDHFQRQKRLNKCVTSRRGYDRLAEIKFKAAEI